jgi:20S proteasome alpha/beta subunit
MTIVAGFNCADGVVLAADTQITHYNNQSQSYEGKIFCVGESCYIGYSGDVAATKEIREELEKEVADNRDSPSLHTALKAKIKQIHKEQFTLAPKNEKTILSLLLVIHEQNKWKLYCTSGGNFFPVDGYQLLGIGHDTGRAVFEPLYSLDLTMQETKNLAAYGLGIVKRYVQGCGGPSHIYAFGNDWISRELDPTPEILTDSEELEERFKFFEKAMRPLLLAFPSSDSKDFAKRLERFAGELQNFRGES